MAPAARSHTINAIHLIRHENQPDTSTPAVRRMR
jgi:hypothetical protein